LKEPRRATRWVRPSGAATEKELKASLVYFFQYFFYLIPYAATGKELKAVVEPSVGDGLPDAQQLGKN
jgi:hypothetical protein